MCICVQEAAIEEYFKPIDKEAEIIMKMQLDGEEKAMKEMMATMHKQALFEKVEAEKIANMQNAGTSQQHDQDPASASATSHAQMRWCRLHLFPWLIF